VSRFEARDPLDRIFEIGIILKGLDGVLEAIGGLLLLAVTPATINRLMVRLTQHELSEDPHDFIARHLLGYTHALTGSAVIFAAVYLLAPRPHQDRARRGAAAKPGLGLPMDDRLPGSSSSATRCTASPYPQPSGSPP